MGRPNVLSRSTSMRRGALAFATAVLLLACGNGDTDDTTTETTAAATSTTAPSTTTSTTTTVAPETTTTTAVADDDAAAALEAAEQFFPALEAAWGYNGTGTPDPNHPDLQRWVTTPVRDNFEDSMATASALGQTVEGAAAFRIEEAPALSADGSFLTVVCFADDAVVLNPDGSVADPADPAARLYELVQVETPEGWATSEFILLENSECVV